MVQARGERTEGSAIRVASLRPWGVLRLALQNNGDRFTVELITSFVVKVMVQSGEGFK